MMYYRRSPHNRIGAGVPVVHVIDDPDHPDRVIVVDAQCNRASMTVRAFHATCRIDPDCEMLSTRVGWDG